MTLRFVRINVTHGIRYVIYIVIYAYVIQIYPNHCKCDLFMFIHKINMEHWNLLMRLFVFRMDASLQIQMFSFLVLRQSTEIFA